MFHDLAVTFGVILLSGAGVIIFGEWKGKTNQDYTNGNLKISVDENSNIHDDLVRDLDLCEKMLNF